MKLSICLIFFLSFTFVQTSWGQQNQCGLNDSQMQLIKNEWENVNRDIQDSLSNKNNYPRNLYNTQASTANLLYMAAYCDERDILSDLADTYLIPYNYLKNNKWVNKDGKEVMLDSSQFIYPLAYTLNKIIDIPAAERTMQMNRYLEKYPGFLSETFARWIYGDEHSMWHWMVCGLPQGRTTSNAYSLLEYVNKKYNNELALNNDAPVYCNAMLEVEMWVAAAVTEFIAAKSKADIESETIIGLTDIDTFRLEKFKEYSKATMRLFESRLSVNISASPLCGGACRVMEFDTGYWRGHPEYPDELWNQAFFGSTNEYTTGTADFDGDGKSDVWQLGKTGAPTSFNVWLSYGKGFKPVQNWGYQSGNNTFGGTDFYTTGTADFNGDGRADVWQLGKTGAPTSFYVWISKGDGFESYKNWSWNHQSGSNTFGGTNFYTTGTADFNGDGRADVWQLGKTGAPTSFYVWISKGDGFESYKNWSWNHQSGNNTFGGTDFYTIGTSDFNGDGQADVWQISKTQTSPTRLHVWLKSQNISGFEGYFSWGPFDTAWDFSHGRRLVRFMETMYNFPQITEPSYDGNYVITLFSNQLVYNIFLCT